MSDLYERMFGAVGAKVGSVFCPLCATNVPVDIPGPWSGTLDEQIEAGHDAAKAQCPHHGEPVLVLSPKAEDFR